MSASSSSLSLNSASASTSANGDASSVGDADGSIASPITESEWSAPASRERKDNRRGNASASSSSRSVRSGGASYGSNNSSRNSRASSPSFSYPTLYEPAPTGQLYDPKQPANTANPQYHGTQYYHPFAPPPQPTAYMPQYPYYGPYPYQAPPPDPHHSNLDASQSRGMEQYPPPAAMHYAPPYAWQPQAASNTQSMPMSPHHLPPPPPPAPGHPISQAPAQPYGYTQPPYPYPHSGYYPPQQMPPGAMTSPPPPSVMQQTPIYEGARAQGPGPGHGSVSAPPHAYNAGGFPQNGRGGNLGNGSVPLQHPGPRNNHPVQNSGFQPNNNGNGNKRNPLGGRNAWSYGPGAGVTYGQSSGPMNGESVGPRLTTSRRQSNNSASSTYSRASSINDDVSSIAVSIR